MQSTQERVDHDAHVQQLCDRGERCFSLGGAARLRRFLGEICPRCRDQRACAVREHQHEVACPAPMCPTQDDERLAFERMLLARDRYALGDAVEVVIGSMSCLPSITSIIMA